MNGARRESAELAPAAVTFATTEHFNLQTGLVLEAAGVDTLAIPVAAAAVIGAAAFTLHERHHRRARDAYNPEAVDRAAIFVPPSQRADAARCVTGGLERPPRASAR